MREVLQPLDDQQWREWRAAVVTSTEVAALFDCSPHTTAFALYHRKKNLEVVELEPNERIKWGTRLQDSIAAGMAEDAGFQIRKMTEFIRDTELGMGASFDFEVVPSGLLEVKNVDALQYRDNWIVDGDDIEAPPHIELQVQTQLFLSGKSFGLIGALVGGNSVKTLHRNPDEKIQGAIVEKVQAFWASVRAGEAPVPDYARDAKLLSRLFGEVREGAIYDGRSDSSLHALAEEYRRLGEEGKEVDKARTALKMQMLERVGDAEKAILDGGTISCGRVAETRVEAFDRVSYRNFRVNWKKGK